MKSIYALLTMSALMFAIVLLGGCQTENITVSIVVSEAAAKSAMQSGTKGKQAYTEETKQDGALNIAIYFGSAKQGAKQEDVGSGNEASATGL